MNIFKIKIITLFVLSCLLSATSYAGQIRDFSFVGDLPVDGVLEFNFSISTDTLVGFETFSNLGGTNAAGQSIVAGGFLPALLLSDSFGQAIDTLGLSSSSGFGSNLGTISSSTLNNTGIPAFGDISFTTFLNAGSYSAFLVENPISNFSGLSSSREYALDILNVDSAVDENAVAVSEPATSLLAMLSLLGVNLLRRRS